METLQTEIQTYKSRLPELLKEEGKFMVIRGEEVLGTFVAYEDALKFGYAACQLEPFLVKGILAIEPVNFSSRLRLAAT
jgi:hypothetical protein